MQTEEWPAPVAGWWQSGNLAAARKDQAEVLDNFFPLAQGVRLRRGSTSYADLGAAVVSLFNYSGTADDLLGATATAVFDVDRVAIGSNAFAEMEGMTSGDWSTTQISTSGGEFLIAVNGADNGFFYNGDVFQALVDETTYDLAFDAETAAFTVGETVTGGTSTATAEIHAITKTSATAGILKLGAITGTFQDNETITDGLTGSATSNIPTGTSTASTIAITGVQSPALSQCFTFKERVFFVEKDTQSVWYLPVESIGGAATEINLGSVFRRGGKLLFGANWSRDAGDGADDICVFVSTNGEIAVYQGTDPSSASTWALIGVYDIGKPLNKHSSFRTGGDLAIMTDDGIIPMSAVIGKDRAGLQSIAATFPIEDAWRKAVADSNRAYPVSATLWQKQTLLLVGVPTTDNGTNVCYVANARTGAWCRYTGWDVRCSAVSGDSLYFGSNDGVVYEGEAGGTDNGTGYTGLCVPKFSSSGAENKFLTRAQVITKATTKPTLKIRGLTNYRVPEITVPTTTDVAETSLWGTGVWGTFVWGGSAEINTYESWKKVSGHGFTIAPAVLITSNDAAASDIEIVSMKMRYETGSVL